MARTKNKVLVIDDEPEITDIISAFLSNDGYEVRVENSPANAVAAARRFRPNLIILDIMMPVMDGYQVCAAFKSDSLLYDIPVLFLTGKNVAEDDGRGFKSGGDLFIKKPFSCDRLLQMVRMVLITVAK
jgi:DNA-binding response OmpR family regulator